MAIIDQIKTPDGTTYDVGNVKQYVGDAYSNTVTYNVGDYCIYDNKLYRCTTKISTAESFTPAHWTETKCADEFAAIKSNLTEKASKDLTWMFSSIFSLSAVYDASSFWDEMNEIIIMVANNNTGTNASYYPIHYYKEMGTMTLVNGYGLGGNTFCQINFNSDTKKITMLDCRNGGTQYAPFIKFYYK